MISGVENPTMPIFRQFGLLIPNFLKNGEHDTFFGIFWIGLVYKRGQPDTTTHYLRKTLTDGKILKISK